jgi:DNA polymerase-3 subunit delta
MVIFLYGPNTYLSFRKVKELEKKFKEKRDKTGLSIKKLEADELDIDSLRINFLSPSLFTEKRLVIIKNFFQQKRDKLLVKEVINWLKKTEKEKDNVVIFWDEEIDEKKLSAEMNELFNLLIKQKYCQKFSLFETDELINWIKKEVVKRGGKIEDKAISFLVEKVGFDLWSLSNEIDKLLANSQTITLKDVESFISFKSQENIWKLIEAVSLKNKKRALELLNELKENFSLNEIFLMIVKEYQTLLKVKGLLNEDKSVTLTDLAKKINLPPFICEKIIKRAKIYSLEELKKIYQQFLKIDYKIKRTSVNLEVLLDLLILNL